MLVFRYTIFIHILIALLGALVLYFSMKPLTNVSELVLLTDAIVSGILLAALAELLKYIAKYGNFASFSLLQRSINYSAIAILFTGCLIGLDFFVLYILYPEREWSSLYHLIPVRIVLSLLAYCVMMLGYNHIYGVSERESDAEFETESEEDTVVSEAINCEQREDIKVEEVPDIVDIVDRIAVKNGQKIDVVMVPDIIYLQAEGDYVMIHSAKGKFLKEQTMKSFENLLPPDKFVRVHRSNIVNIDYISQIELYNKQSQLLKLKNGSQVKISISGYRALKKALGL